MADACASCARLQAEVDDVAASAADLAIATYGDAGCHPEVVSAAVTMTLADISTANPDRLRHLRERFTSRTAEIILRRLTR